MKKLIVLAACAVLWSQVSAAQGTGAQKPVQRSKTPKSLFEATGWYLPTAAEKAASTGGPGANALFTTATATKQFGTVYFLSDESCPVSSVLPAFTTLFSQSFTTGLAQTSMQIAWSGEVNIDTPPPGGNYDAVLMVCRYKQGGGPYFSCPGYSTGPAILSTAGTTTPNFLGQTALVGFQTVVPGLIPDTLTTVELLITSFSPQALGYSVCAQNLVIQQ